jgi:hypothetical protein
MHQDSRSVAPPLAPPADPFPHPPSPTRVLDRRTPVAGRMNLLVHTSLNGIRRRRYLTWQTGRVLTLSQIARRRADGRHHLIANRTWVPVGKKSSVLICVGSTVPTGSHNGRSVLAQEPSAPLPLTR